jgi:MoxR-like ATPase
MSHAAALSAAEPASVASRLGAARDEIRASIIGQDEAVDLSLAALLAGGHFLLTGLPGLGKTKLVETLSAVLGLGARRIQCTPDLMPADVTGSEILEADEKGGRRFRFVEGPVFCQLLMADEINRASPRTQSAFLQAMQEHRVTVNGTTYDLPKPFHVMATQNPLEQEGTYPLPEAQLDRFLLQITLRHPELADERRMILATTGAAGAEPRAILSASEVMAAQDLVRRMPVGEQVVDAILALVRSGRPEQSDIPDVKKHVSWGPGPRAAQALMLATRARALLDGRLSPSVDDVQALAPSVLAHRMALRYSARAEGVSLDGLIARMCGRA